MAVRKCFPVLGLHILKLINLSFRCKVFPDSWKVALVVPIPKSGDPAIPSNNRPISLLSVLSKILEKVACTQLTSYLHETRILHPSQYAYRPRHSTEDAVLDTRALQWSGNPYGDGYGLEMDGNGAQFVKRLWIGLDLGKGHQLQTIQ